MRGDGSGGDWNKNKSFYKRTLLGSGPVTLKPLWSRLRSAAEGLGTCLLTFMLDPKVINDSLQKVNHLIYNSLKEGWILAAWEFDI